MIVLFWALGIWLAACVLIVFLIQGYDKTRWSWASCVQVMIAFALPFAFLFDAVAAPIRNLFTSGKIPQDSAEADTSNHKEGDNA